MVEQCDMMRVYLAVVEAVRKASLQCQSISRSRGDGDGFDGDVVLTAEVASKAVKDYCSKLSLGGSPVIAICAALERNDVCLLAQFLVR
jgi:hypothetical protein